jgi:hypothetical protein
MFIKGHCHTSIDIFKFVKFPNLFVGVPQIGQRVQAKGPVFYKDKHGESQTIMMLELYIVGVIHSQSKDGVPHMNIELHHPNAHQLGWIF